MRNLRDGVFSQAAAIISMAALFTQIAACAQQPAEPTQVQLRITDPAGEVDILEGELEQVIGAYLVELDRPVVVDQVESRDPARLLEATVVTFTGPSGEVRLVGGDHTLEVATDDPLRKMAFSWSPELDTLIIDMHGGAYYVEITGPTAPDRARFMGSVIVKTLTGQGVSFIKGMEQGQEIITAILIGIILIELAMIAGQVVNYVSLTDCQALNPPRCRADAIAQCQSEGAACAFYTPSCECGFWCSIGISSVEGGCEIGCSNNPADCAPPPET